MQSISWQAYEYDHKPKTTDWFWAVSIITIAISVVSIIMNDVLFGVFVLLAGFALALYSTREPRIIRASVNDKSIRVNNIVFPFSEIQAFCVATDINYPSLVLTLKKPIMPHVVIPLGDADAQGVERMLSLKLQEVPYVEPMAHKIFDAFGF